MIRGLIVSAVIVCASVAHAQQFDAKGWTLLGTQEVAGKKDRDTIMVGKQEGKFDKITIVVTDSDIELKELTVHFGNGEKWSPGMLKHVFKEGQRSRAIDLPGNDRQIAKIDLLYANLPGGGKAKVSIYAKNTKAKPAGGKPDMTGWTLLGGQQVGGKKDRDTFAIGKYEGKFDQVQMNVLDSDLEVLDMTIVFANGERWQPKIKHSFKEGQRSRAIDLPGADRTIAKIELTYANTPGGGKAYVELYARSRKAGPTQGPTMPQPTPAAFNPQGWTLLGTQTVQGNRDRDTIRVGRKKGGFDQLTMVVSDSDLDLKDFTIVFTGGQRWTPNVKHVFKEGSRTRVIDLPGKDRTITRIELAYANLPGGGKAKVEIYARDVGRPAPTPIAPITWDNKGWTFLGKRTVDGWRDRDRLNVGAGKPFSEVMFVVSGSDVQLNNIVITLGNNEKFEMSSAVVFKEGTRTSPIDIPGKLRKIRSIDFAYANLPGGGRAQIEVWGRARVQPATPATTTPPPPPTQAPLPPPPTSGQVRDHRKGT